MQAAFGLREMLLTMFF